MISSLKQRCDLFIKNKELMKINFKWENSMLFPLCSIIYTEKELEIDSVKIKLCKDIIKNNTGFFSSFNGTPLLALSVMLSLEDNPHNKFKEVLIAYEKLKHQFRSSTYLPFSAYAISSISKDYEYDKVVNKAKEVYDKMKKEHPFLTSGEDSIYAVLTANSNKTGDDVIIEMEKCYKLLHNTFSSSNVVQTLSHILALGDEDAYNKCSKLISMFDRLRERKCKYGKGLELAVLALITLLTEDLEQSVNDIIEVNDHLLTKKGFGKFSMTNPQRLMYSAVLAAQEKKKHSFEMNMSAVNSITSIIIAQQAAMIAVMAACTSASVSNS